MANDRPEMAMGWPAMANDRPEVAKEWPTMAIDRSEMANKSTEKPSNSLIDYIYDNDPVKGNMILRGLIPRDPVLTTTAAPSGRSQVVLALTVVLVVLVIMLIISIFLLLYCLLRRQEGKSERRRREAYEEQHRIKTKSRKIVSDSQRRAKVSRIAADIEAAVKSSESIRKPSRRTSPPPSSPAPPKLTKRSPPLPPPPPPSLRQRFPSPVKPAKPAAAAPPSETAVEAPQLYINRIYVSRRRDGTWQQVEREPSDFSYELDSDSVNDDICLQPL